jgi:HPt (histidine-containing phosphotransfer) domain-containing protein
VTTERPPETLDYEALLDELGGDRKLRRNLLEMLVASTTESSVLIRTAYTQRDSAALASSAHKLRSALVAFGAQPAANAASQLEDIGRRADLAAASAVLDRLQDELTRLQLSVAQLLTTEEVEQ